MDNLNLPPLILSPVPLDTLLTSFRQIIREEIAAEQSLQLQDKLLTTEEVCKLLSVTAVTVSAWIAKDKLKRYSIGNRNRFKYSEVMESLQTLKKYKTI